MSNASVNSGRVIDRIGMIIFSQGGWRCAARAASWLDVGHQIPGRCGSEDDWRPYGDCSLRSQTSKAPRRPCSSRRSRRPWPSTPEGEAQKAREVARFYTLLFSHPAAEAITWWDFTGFPSWQGAPAGLLGKDINPKPAHVELKRLIKSAWWTRTRLRSGPDGTAAFRGFLGDYRLTVRWKQKPAVTVAFHLDRRQANRWTVKAG